MPLKASDQIYPRSLPIEMTPGSLFQENIVALVSNPSHAFEGSYDNHIMHTSNQPAKLDMKTFLYRLALVE